MQATVGTLVCTGCQERLILHERRGEDATFRLLEELDAWLALHRACQREVRTSARLFSVVGD